MSQQGPILVVSTAQAAVVRGSARRARLFPVIEADWADAARAVEQVQPAAVLARCSEIDEAGLAALAKHVAARQPYLPLIAVDPRRRFPKTPFRSFRARAIPIA